mmetsp:Transcript_71558/g.207190  ORF Transcript_71558/g.207190 Transcript_71558/m.207190 type:complete len:226 (+) Transcript_71558:890-1567(+)
MRRRPRPHELRAHVGSVHRHEGYVHAQGQGHRRPDQAGEPNGQDAATALPERGPGCAEILLRGLHQADTRNFRGGRFFRRGRCGGPGRNLLGRIRWGVTASARSHIVALAVNVQVEHGAELRRQGARILRRGEPDDEPDPQDVQRVQDRHSKMEPILRRLREEGRLPCDEPQRRHEHYEEQNAGARQDLAVTGALEIQPQKHPSGPQKHEGAAARRPPMPVLRDK